MQGLQIGSDSRREAAYDDNNPGKILPKPPLRQTPETIVATYLTVLLSGIAACVQPLFSHPVLMATMCERNLIFGMRESD